MAEKRQSKPAEIGWAIPNAFKGFDGQALFALQQRNVEAMTRAASLMADAAAQITGKQFEIFQKAANLHLETPQLDQGAEGFGGFLERQMKAGREVFESSIKQTRELNDAVRNCYYSIADEFQACARDNLNLLEEETEAVTGAGKSAKSTGTQQQPERPQAVSA